MGFAPSSMQLTSTAFAAGGVIPAKHTGEGEDVSPGLAWSDAPAEAKSFAVICHDPDAPLVSPNGTYGFVHWVHYNIPGSTHSLVEGCTEHTQGKTDFGKVGYGGPMPPEGHGTHHYYFWILALDTDKTFDEGLTMWEFLKQAEANIIGMNRLIGTYIRT